MKKLSLAFLLLMLFGVSSVSAENNHFFRPKTTTFSGESENWQIVYRMYLKGTEVSYELEIKYKGKDEKIKAKTLMLHQLDKKGIYESGAWGFQLDRNNRYRSGVITDCYGCQYRDKDKQMIFIVNRWDEIAETVVLTNKTRK